MQCRFVCSMATAMLVSMLCLKATVSGAEQVPPNPQEKNTEASKESTDNKEPPVEDKAASSEAQNSEMRDSAAQKDNQPSSEEPSEDAEAPIKEETKESDVPQSPEKAAEESAGDASDVKDETAENNLPESDKTEASETAEQVVAQEEAAPSSTDAAVEFEGIVLSPLGAPIKGATVFFPDANVKVTSSAEGTFVAPLAQGEHKVVVQAEGFSSLEEMLILDESAALTGIELLLELPIEDVVVTGTKTEKLVEKAPIKTQVVGRESIERKKASNLADTLETTSGVRVENDCQNCGFTQVRLNGLEGRYTQILIDGKPVMSSLAGVYGLEQIPQEMIERVEIVKGGGSALYGGNAVGGVVNVISARPRKNFANVQLRGGAVGIEEPEFRLGASAGVVNKDRDLALHVFGGAYAREPWDANGDGFSEVGKARQVTAGAEAYIDVPHDGELQLKFHVLQENRRGGDAFDKTEHDAAIAESIKTRRYGGELRFKQLVNSHFSYDLGYGFAYTERDSYYGAGGDVELDDPPTQEQWEAKLAALNAYGKTKNPVHTADGTVNIAYSALGEQIVTAGVQFLSDSLDDKFSGYDREVDEVYWNIAGVLQHDWMITDWAETVIGLRLDKHSELDAPVVSPRAAVMFSPLEWLRTRTSFSTGFRAPQVFDEDLHITIVSGEGQIIYNDPDLDPERSYSVAQQVEFDFDIEDDWKIKLSLNGFWTRINDAFVISQDDDESTVGEIEMIRENHGNTTVFGGEIELTAAFGKTWGAGTGWTFEHAENSEEDPDFGTKKIMRTPSVYGYVETWVNVLNGLEFSTVLDITGPMKVPHYAGYIEEDTLEESPWFADWSANVSYKFDLKNDRYITPFIGIRNILDSRQDDYDKGADRDAGYVYGPRLPRTLFAGIKGGI